MQPVTDRKHSNISMSFEHFLIRILRIYTLKKLYLHSFTDIETILISKIKEYWIFKY